MSRGSRSKVDSTAKSNDDNITEEDYDNVEDRSSTSHQPISRKSRDLRFESAPSWINNPRIKYITPQLWSLISHSANLKVHKYWRFKMVFL